MKDLVHAGALNHVRWDQSDSHAPRVIVECGATVKEVNDVLERHGYALAFNVVLESVRFGGLIATGSHGSGWNHQTLSDLVHAMDVVVASGEIRRFETGVASEDVMITALPRHPGNVWHRLSNHAECANHGGGTRAIDRRAANERQCCPTCGSG